MFTFSFFFLLQELSWNWYLSWNLSICDLKKKRRNKYTWSSFQWLCNIGKCLRCPKCSFSGETWCWMKSPNPSSFSTSSHRQSPAVFVALSLFKSLKWAFEMEHPQCNLRENNLHTHFYGLFLTLLSIRIPWELADQISGSWLQTVWLSSPLW